MNVTTVCCASTYIGMNWIDFELIHILHLGPQMQDLEEIKSRALLARAKATESETSERLNLAFSRIDLRHKACATLSEKDDKYLDEQFNTMVECVKKRRSRECEIYGTLSTAPAPSIDDSLNKIIFAAAKQISTRRLLSSEAHDVNYLCKDPYRTFAKIFSDTDYQQVNVRLEDLHATIMAAKSARDAVVCAAEKTKSLDQKATDIGKRLVNQLRNISVPVSKSSKRSESTLFGDHVPCSENLKLMLGKGRDLCTKALSLYQGREYCEDQTLEWCDILLDVIEISSQTLERGGNHTNESNYGKVVAGVMAIQGFTQSTCHSYGIGLKTARVAWEKDGTELGNLITLFFCALQYESFSTETIDDCPKAKDYAYPNTLLELDGALIVYESLSKLEKSDSLDNLKKLLSVFPLLCKFAIKKKVLLLSLQRRMTEISIKVSTCMLSKEVRTDSDVNDEIVTTVFGILRGYLVTLEEVLETSFFVKEKQWQLEQLVGLQSTLGSTLDLLILVRDQNIGIGTKAICNDFALDDNYSFLKDKFTTPQHHPSNEIPLFEKKSVKSLIGTQNECLWIGESI